MRFKSFFNTNYEQLYVNLLPSSRSKKEVKFLTKFIASKQASILDLGCGWGRHLKELALMGYKDLTGVDYAKELLKKSRDNLKAFKTIKLILNDFVEYQSSKKFDFIYQTFQSFGFNDNSYDQKNLNNVRKLLAPKGVYLLDLRNPVRLAKEEKFDFPKRGIKTEEIYDKNSKRFKLNYYFEGRNDTVGFNVYTLKELTKMLNIAGLKITSTFGDFDGEPYSPTSNRLIIVSSPTE